MKGRTLDEQQLVNISIMTISKSIKITEETDKTEEVVQVLKLTKSKMQENLQEYY